MHMIAFVHLDLNRIHQSPADYSWPRPECPRCGSATVWGHGFVSMYFEGFETALEMRRYRCPVCRCVIRLRPLGYFPRLQTTIENIRSILAQRLHTGRWPGPGLRSRAGHWLRALKTNARALLGLSWRNNLLGAFDRLLREDRMPVSRLL